MRGVRRAAHRTRGGAGKVPIEIYTATQMLGDGSLRGALAIWDAQVVELETGIVRVMDEMFLGESPPILRPGRRSPS